ncbi:unnamed protein product [Caenorhabditis bovis]|uniref:Uncharacterized protein n=1 Tax=Caenorhabditis bovis TaxID=2654633 RepID=A0A8S1F6U0_9PELO|nr:unnamed protein product [Caenorhabditis bovis]
MRRIAGALNLANSTWDPELSHRIMCQMYREYQNAVNRSSKMLYLTNIVWRFSESTMPHEVANFPYSAEFFVMKEDLSIPNPSQMLAFDVIDALGKYASFATHFIRLCREKIDGSDYIVYNIILAQSSKRFVHKTSEFAS